MNWLINMTVAAGSRQSLKLAGKIAIQIWNSFENVPQAAAAATRSQITFIMMNPLNNANRCQCFEEPKKKAKMAK